MKVIGLAGWSGAGKTTLLTRLIPHLNAIGVSVSTIKHAHHDFDVDQPNKDSWRHRQAGAREVLISSSRRFALMHELRGAAEPEVDALLGRLAPVDLVIIEGFKRAPYRKIEVYRAALSKPPLWPNDAGIVGIAASDPVEAAIPVVQLDDIDAVASLLLASAAPVAMRAES